VRLLLDTHTLLWWLNDPFDRLLIAQAHLENLITVSRDSRFTPYGIQLIEA